MLDDKDEGLAISTPNVECGGTDKTQDVHSNHQTTNITNQTYMNNLQ